MGAVTGDHSLVISRVSQPHTGRRKPFSGHSNLKHGLWLSLENGGRKLLCLAAENDA